MIPFLPEFSAAPVPAATPSLPGLAEGTGAGTGEAGDRPALDFAGLLDAVLPGGAQALPEALPEAASGTTAGAPGAAGQVPPVMRSLPALKTTAPLLPEALPPSGTGLPDRGAELPPADITLPPLQPPHTALADAPAPTVPPAATSQAPAEAPAHPDAALPEAALLALLPAALPAPLAPLPPARVGSTGDPARAVPAAAPAVTAPHRVSLPLDRTGEEEVTLAPLPASLASDAPEAGIQPASPGPAPALAQPASPALAQPAPPAAPAPVVERAEPRSLAPQQETAIAQVGEIREALRAARPELTLRHAEFGVVSLRIDAPSAAAPQDWRAVLASRDPGFVPAIQAALAERAVSASADTAATGNGAGQGGSSHSSSFSSSDQRYGFSQGSGQGSSSPYPGQSGTRDEGASQHPRGPQQGRTDESAAGAGGAPDSEASDRRERGLFA